MYPTRKMLDLTASSTYIEFGSTNHGTRYDFCQMKFAFGVTSDVSSKERTLNAIADETCIDQ